MPGERSFLGTGWSFPPRFSAGGADVAMVSDAADIHQSLEIILATQVGERVMQEVFGCDLRGYLFEEIDQDLLNSLSTIITDAILYHEPRIELDDLDISADESVQGKLLIRLDYTVKSVNSRYNLVYPFYLDEADIPVS